MIARTVFFNSAPLNTSLMGLTVGPASSAFLTDSFHFSDSGTNKRMNLQQRRHRAGLTFTQRHEST